MLVKEYAKLVGVSAQSVTKRLRQNRPTKAISSFRKFANTFDLVINEGELTKLILKKIKREKKHLIKETA